MTRTFLVGYGPRPACGDGAPVGGKELGLSILAVLCPAFVGNAVFVNLVVHHSAGDAQEPGGFLLDPVGPSERLEKSLFFEGFEVQQLAGHERRRIVGASVEPAKMSKSFAVIGVP